MKALQLKIWKHWQVWMIKNNKGEVIGYYGRNFDPEKIKEEQEK